MFWFQHKKEVSFVSLPFNYSWIYLERNWSIVKICNNFQKTLQMVSLTLFFPDTELITSSRSKISTNFVSDRQFVETSLFLSLHVFGLKHIDSLACTATGLHNCVCLGNPHRHFVNQLQLFLQHWTWLVAAQEADFFSGKVILPKLTDFIVSQVGWLVRLPLWHFLQDKNLSCFF